MKQYLILVIIFIFFIGCEQNSPQPSYAVKQKQITIVKEQVPKEPSVMIDNDLDNDKIKLEDKIAIIFASNVIGKYASEVTNAAMGYLIYKNSNFNLEVFDVKDEKLSSIENGFQQIHDKQISKVLVLFTYKGAKLLSQVKNIDNSKIYLPLIEKTKLDLKLDQAVYGSINYQLQFNKLLEYGNNKQIDFYDNSDIGLRLSQELHQSSTNIKYKKMIDNNNKQYSKFLYRKRKLLNNSTLVLNMPIVKSSIILSQLIAKEIYPYQILSTQLNYTPLILSLTQSQDRKNLILANSIGNIDNKLEEYSFILNGELPYNWVNYATIIGIEYLLYDNVDSFSNIKIENQQIQYPVSLYRTTSYSFEQL